MCSYSNMIGDWWHPTWPTGPTPQPFAPSPNSIPWPTITADPKLAQQMIDVLGKLEIIDKRLNNLDCKVEKASKQRIVGKLKRITRKKRLGKPGARSSRLEPDLLP